MATDGVKIINSDLAQDTYWSIMDLYDSGIDLDRIKTKIPLDLSHYDDFNKEIYVTAYALALWEIGALRNEDLMQVRVIIDKGAGVQGFIEEWGESAGKARKRELDKFLKKISTLNPRIRKRKKYRTITRFHYSSGDVLTFQGSDEKYYCTYLLFVLQHRGECVYYFIPFAYSNNKKPGFSDILSSNLVGDKLGDSLGLSADMITRDFGLKSIGVLHQQLVDYKSHLEKIGHFDLSPQYKKISSEAGSRSWDDFSYHHEWIEYDVMKDRLRVYKIGDLMIAE